MKKKFELSKKAQKVGGPCPICGWIEGNGVTVCYYDKDVGQVTHHNKYPAGLNAKQKTLYDCYNDTLNAHLVYIDEAARRRDIRQYLKDRIEAWNCGNILCSIDEEKDTRRKWIAEAKREQTLQDISDNNFTFKIWQGSGGSFRDKSGKLQFMDPIWYSRVQTKTDIRPRTNM